MSNWYPVGKAGANVTYSSEAACEAAEGQACYDITGKDMRYHVVADTPILDEEGNPRLDMEGNPLHKYDLVEDESLKALVLNADANVLASETAISVKLANMEFGKRVLAIVAIRNDEKVLTQEQVITLSNTYAPIQALLLSGSIATAKGLIEAITPDEVLVTVDDLTAVLAEMNDYLGV